MSGWPRGLQGPSQLGAPEPGFLLRPQVQRKPRLGASYGRYRPPPPENLCQGPLDRVLRHTLPITHHTHAFPALTDGTSHWKQQRWDEEKSMKINKCFYQGTMRKCLTEES